MALGVGSGAAYEVFQIVSASTAPDIAISCFDSTILSVE